MDIFDPTQLPIQSSIFLPRHTRYVREEGNHMLEKTLEEDQEQEHEEQEHEEERGEEEQVSQFTT